MPDDGKISGLYERDFYEWSGDQARAIRAAQAALSDGRVNDVRASLTELDWENVAEEIESLGRSDRQGLENRIATIIEHLLKLEFSPAAGPRAGWEETVGRSRDEIAMLLRTSPSLRRLLPEIMEDRTESARRIASRSLAHYGERAQAACADLAERRYTGDQILDDWWPAAAEDGT